MDDDPLIARLHQLASDPRNRPKAARLRDIVAEVEATLSAGVARVQVLDVLKEHGIDMSLATFATTLRRIRLKNGKTKVSPVPSPAPNPTVIQKGLSQSPEGSSSSIVRAESPSYDPRDIDRILATDPDLKGLAKLAKKGIRK